MVKTLFVAIVIGVLAIAGAGLGLAAYLAVQWVSGGSDAPLN